MWCPKCKMEYREGITTCADCGTTLVPGTEADFNLVDICEFKKEDLADRFLEYLQYSGVEGAKKVEKEEGTVFSVEVPAGKERKAEKLFRGFLLGLSEEDTEADELSDKQESTESETTEKEAQDDATQLSDKTQDEVDLSAQESDHKTETPQTTSYASEIEEMPEEMLYESIDEFVPKAEEYRDYLYSGLTFLIFDVVAAVFIALCHFGVIPLEFGNYTLIVAALAIVAFLALGIVNTVKASHLKLEIPAEEERTDEILNWLSQNIPAATLTSWRDETISQEENDLLIVTKIGETLAETFSEETALYREYIADLYYTRSFAEAEKLKETTDKETTDKEATDKEATDKDDTDKDDTDKEATDKEATDKDDTDKDDTDKETTENQETIED